MLPLIKFPAYAMGGRDEIPVNALPNITPEEFRLNDGIVNTRSMDGPVGPYVDNGDFAAQYRAGQIAKGKYWHFGRNSTIDHADQVGVFTSDNTVSLFPM
jgi:hypothetical protein